MFGRRRRYPAGMVVVAVAAAAAACSSPSSASPPSSPLARPAPLTCATPVRACTAPGTLRWSQPLSGSQALDGGGGTLLELGMSLAEGGGNPDQGTVASSGSLLVYQRGGLVIAIDPVTGRKLWTDHLGSDLFASSVPLLGSGQIAVAGTPVFDVGQPGQAWVLNAATGRPGHPIPLPCGARQGTGCDPPGLLALTSGHLMVLARSGVEALDTGTGAVSWRAPGDPLESHVVMGGVLYADRTPAAIQRISLVTGSVLPALPLTPSLRGGTVVTSAAQAGALVVAAGQAAGRLNRDTGRPVWIRSLAGAPSTALPHLVQADPAGSPPAALLFDFPSPAPRGDWRLRSVSLATGAALFSLRDSQAAARHYPGITAWNFDNWNVYDSLLLSQTPPPGARTNDLTVGRLIGLDPATGREQWQGPRSDADQLVLGQTAVTPHLIIVLGCAPGTMRAEQSIDASAVCDQSRLYAINP
jgi:hypothetical protein